MFWLVAGSDFILNGGNTMRADDQGLSFAFCCGSVGSLSLCWFQCQILKGSLELNIFPIYFQTLFTHQAEEL